MSRRDTHHEVVVRALEKDQWIITDDTLALEFVSRKFGYFRMVNEEIIQWIE
jgi:hypothetical protein